MQTLKISVAANNGFWNSKLCLGVKCRASIEPDTLKGILSLTVPNL